MRKLMLVIVVVALTTQFSLEGAERSDKGGQLDHAKFKFLQSFKQSGHGQKAARTVRKPRKARKARAARKAHTPRVARQSASSTHPSQLQRSGAAYRESKTPATRRSQ